MNETPHAILGVPVDATVRQIKDRYRFLAQAYHPDKFGSERHRADAEESFKRISDAYRVMLEAATSKERKEGETGESKNDRRNSWEKGASNTSEHASPPDPERRVPQWMRRRLLITCAVFLAALVVGFVLQESWFSSPTEAEWPVQFQIPSQEDNAKSNASIEAFLQFKSRDDGKRAFMEGVRSEMRYETGWESVSTPDGNRFKILFGENEVRTTKPSKDHPNKDVRKAYEYPLNVINDSRGIIWQYPAGLGNLAFLCDLRIEGDLLIFTYESDGILNASKGRLIIDRSNNTFTEEIEVPMPPIPPRMEEIPKTFFAKGYITRVTVDK